MPKNNDLGNVKELLEAFLQNEYEFVSFSELTGSNHKITLRHDIDFDLEASYKMAIVEKELGISATYFFLITNDSYNLFSKKNYDYVHLIKELGHTISIHFDPTIYSDFEDGFKKEKNCFESFFHTSPEIISLHRPNSFFQEYDSPISGCDHTYMKKYFKDIKYISDSTGVFRYGHPLESQEFKDKQSIHLLLHPIWWFFNGNKNTEKLKSFFSHRTEEMKQHYSANCKPFNDILDEL